MADLLNAYEASKEIGVSRSTFSKLVKEGKIPIAEYSYAGTHRFDVEEVKEAMKKLQEEKEQYITYRQVAELLGVSYATAVRYHSLGYFSAVEGREKGWTLFRRDEVLAFANSYGGVSDADFLTVRELALRTGTSASFIYALVKDKSIKPARRLPSGRSYFSTDTVEVVMKQKHERA